jgi:hypothetical protein
MPNLVKYQTDELYKIIKLRYESLKSKRGTWEAHWQQIADLMHPFDDNFVSHESPGSDKMTFIFDSTPIHANQLLSAGLFSMLTSPAQKWFEIRMMAQWMNQIREVQEWLEVFSNIAYLEINKPIAQFNTSMHELYLEYGAFGNGVMFVTETLNRQNLKFQALPLSESYMCEGANGIMDVLLRRYPRTVRQLVQKFGADNMADAIKAKIQAKKIDDVVKCVHAIIPTSDYGIKAPFSYASVYVDMENKHVIDTSGYFELPFMAPRFYKNPWEMYGRGPGTTALPDNKMLQEVMRTTIRAAQKATDPPLQAPDDGFLNPIRTTPGGINFYRQGMPDRIEPINFGSNPGVGFDVVSDLRGRIREIFFIDQLQLQDGPQMTATEVLQRTEEKLRLMGPLMGRLQSELLGPMLNRVFAILIRQGKIPPPPAILEGQEFKITYTSPIARAQEQTEANGIMRSLQVLTPFLEMDPSVTDRFNGDELTKGVFEMFSVSPRFLRTDEQVEAIRTDRKQNEADKQQAANMQSAGQGFESVTRAGLNLKEIQSGGE